MKSNKEKPSSRFAAYLIRNFPPGLKGLHLMTGIPYTKLSREINDQLYMPLKDFYLITLAVNPEDVNKMADEIFHSYQEDNDINPIISVDKKPYTNIQENEFESQSLSEFGKFLSLHINSKKEISNLSGIALNTINSLIKEDSTTTSKLIAVKFYKLCKMLERDFYKWTTKFYPNARLTTEDERKILEDNFYKNNLSFDD